MIANELLKHRT